MMLHQSSIPTSIVLQQQSLATSIVDTFIFENLKFHILLTFLFPILHIHHHSEIHSGAWAWSFRVTVVIAGRSCAGRNSHKQNHVLNLPYLNLLYLNLPYLNLVYLCYIVSAIAMSSYVADCLKICAGGACNGVCGTR